MHALTLKRSDHIHKWQTGQRELDLEVNRRCLELSRVEYCHGKRERGGGGGFERIILVGRRNDPMKKELYKDKCEDPGQGPELEMNKS